MRPPSSSRVHPLIISAGLNGSGSTWVFNMIVDMLGRADPALLVHTAYSDEFLEDVAATEADTTVVKTHRLPPMARILAGMARVPIVLTVRDPRDGVASMMRRFGLAFPHALEDVRQSAEALAPLAGIPGVLALRYEDGFIRDRATLDAIAGHLGLTLSRADGGAVWRALRPKAVRAAIDKLSSDGVFAEAPAVLTFDARTHWHPGHVGEGRIGSWREVLSARQASDVDQATAAFRAAFGYAAGESSVALDDRRPPRPGEETAPHRPRILANRTAGARSRQGRA